MKERNLKEKEIYDAKKDPRYQKPYIDADEMRERELCDGRRLPYRYVHGGFRDTNAKFVFCMPVKENYKGRFFQYMCPFPGPDEEMASLARSGEDDTIAFCLANGAYFIETNMESSAAFGGHPNPHLIWKSSAAAAEYSRQVAMEYYGCERPYGYVFGGSGGGYKSIACIENTNAWDGACPFVIGSPYSLPNTITLHAQGMRTLRHAFPRIIDALDAGGSGDMYEGLTEDEKKMLREVTLMGFPPQAWFVEAAGRFDDGSLPVLTPGVKQTDPSYFKDFWEVPGYLGAEEGSNARKDRLQFTGKVKSVHMPGQPLSVEEKAILKEVIKDEETGKKQEEYSNGVDTAWKKQLADGSGSWIELEEVPQGEDLYLKGVNITVQDGEAAGKQLLLGDIIGNFVLIGMCYGMDDLAGVLGVMKPGDTVTLDNSDYIAIQSYYRHQVPPDPAFHAWDQFRDENGKPAIPQRSYIMGPDFCGTGTVQEGTIQGKVIINQSLMDESTCPWCGDWYRSAVRKYKGNEDDFRIYYNERCTHGDVSALDTDMVVNYLGALKQSLLDISDWVERGIEPRQSSSYEMEGGIVHMEKDPAKRKGLQPIIAAGVRKSGEKVQEKNVAVEKENTKKNSITAVLDGMADCIHIKTGENVMLWAAAEVPEGSGKITELKFSLSDPMFGTYANRKLGGDYVSFMAAGRSERVKGQLHHFTTEDGRDGAYAAVETSYDKPGTYFATAFVKSQRDGLTKEPYTQIKNLARMRIIVE